ncbi:MAG: DMT family transporter [Clostridia bacterium]|nr:DMT family transporter [Clostridia bacterium]
MAKNVAGSKESLGVFLAIVSAAALGAESIAAKLAYAGGANILTILAIRYLLAALLFWGVLFTRPGLQKPAGATLGWLTFVALSGQGTTVLLLFYSFQYIPAAVAILFFYVFPAVVTLLAAIFLREALTKAKLLALAITFCGLIIILGVPGSNLDTRGVIAALLAALTNGYYIVGQTRLLKEVNPLVYNAYMTLTIGLGFLLLALTSASFNLDFNLQAWLAIAVLILVCTVLAFVAMAWGLVLIGASRVAIISTVEPIVTAILGYLILGELLKPGQVLGGLIILAGVAWLQISGRRPQSTQSALDKLDTGRN